MKNMPWMRNQLFLFLVHLLQMKTLFVVSIRKVHKLSLFWKLILFVTLSLKNLVMSSLFLTHMVIVGCGA
jgi:hypothetical protein